MAWLDPWWKWLLSAVGVWSFPASMMVVWFCCYAERFGEPPCDCWAPIAIDGLFVANFVAIAALLILSGNYTWRLVLAIPLSIAEIIVAGSVWLIGGASVSGFFL